MNERAARELARLADLPDDDLIQQGRAAEDLLGYARDLDGGIRAELKRRMTAAGSFAIIPEEGKGVEIRTKNQYTWDVRKILEVFPKPVALENGLIEEVKIPRQVIPASTELKPSPRTLNATLQKLGDSPQGKRLAAARTNTPDEKVVYG